MALNIKNAKVEQLAAELAQMTGETKTAAILRALEERRERIVAEPSNKQRLEHLMDFLRREVWPTIPPENRGRPLTKKERERILGYGKHGV
ncbi:MAG TPA: type II toxin-antitoxin system VapB family antitoxin [Thermoanaerobaculia bacterium]|nr:type II toxin-antitoxin system VapB family antitoxin [Thermoanaerobaculia bacterium]